MGMGFIPNASLVFSSKNKSMDYHDSMNADLFEKWFVEKLLSSLECPSLIVLDNASYHSRLVEKAPNKSTPKSEMALYLKKKGIPFEVQMTKVELLNLIEEQRKNKRFVIDELAMHAGHKVLRLPPYHCVFNPIELVWAQCKNYYNRHIGRNGFGDNKVISMWEDALLKVDESVWKNTISHTDSIMKAAYENEKLLCEMDETPQLVINPTDSESDSE